VPFGAAGNSSRRSSRLARERTYLVGRSYQVALFHLPPSHRLSHTPDVIAPSTPPTPPLTTRLLPVHLSYVRCAHSTVRTPDQPTDRSRQPTTEGRPAGVDHNGDQKAVNVIRDDRRQSSRGRQWHARPRLISAASGVLQGLGVHFAATATQIRRHWRWGSEPVAYTSL